MKRLIAHIICVFSLFLAGCAGIPRGGMSALQPYGALEWLMYQNCQHPMSKHNASCKQEETKKEKAEAKQPPA